MNDYYTLTDGHGNFVFFDNTVKEVKFDNKVARRSGMTSTVEKARKIKERAIEWHKLQCEAEVIKNKTMQDYYDHSERTEDEKEQHKTYYQEMLDDLLSKKFSIVKVTYEIIEDDQL